jgi:undecaprenyl-diphosphatase
MDTAVVLTLNALAIDLPGIGRAALMVAQYGILLYGVLMLVLWWRATDARRRVLLLAVLAALGALGINAVLNQVVPRPRPYLVLPIHVLETPAPRDASFPSDHAAVTAALAMTLLLADHGAAGTAGLVGALLIGTARVMIGLHYPTDIIGGVLVGLCSAIILTRVQGRLRPILVTMIAVARRIHLG